MQKLNTEFTKEEEEMISKWKDPKLIILNEIYNNCYLINEYGNLSYEECIGKTSDSYFNTQHYFLAQPRRMIKFYSYYLLEDENEIGEWYVGEKQKNGEIEFYKCSENLMEAFDSL